MKKSGTGPENIQQSYALFRLPLNTPFELVKRRYRALIKNCHPDINRDQSETVYLLNAAYERIEKYEKNGVRQAHPAEAALESSNLGLAKMALKRYCKGLYQKKASFNAKHRRMKAEVSIIKGVILEIDKALEQFHSQSLERISTFLKGLLAYHALPYRLKAMNLKDRKLVRRYVLLVKNMTRLLEECFSRLDGVKKKTGLWRMYYDTVRDLAQEFQVEISETLRRKLSFLPAFLEDLEYINELFKNNSSIVNFGEFYRFFKPELPLYAGGR